MAREICGIALLSGMRGWAPADLEALADAIVSLSTFALTNRERLAGADINPFVVRPAGGGALGLDAVVGPKDR